MERKHNWNRKAKSGLPAPRGVNKRENFSPYSSLISKDRQCVTIRLTVSNGPLIFICKMRQYDTIFYQDDKMKKLFITLPVRNWLILWTNYFKMPSI